MNEERSKYKEGLAKIGVKIAKLKQVQDKAKLIKKENTRLQTQIEEIKTQNTKYEGQIAGLLNYILDIYNNSFEICNIKKN